MKRRAHNLHSVFIAVSSFCVIVLGLSNIYTAFAVKFRSGSQTILEKGSSMRSFHRLKVGICLRVSSYHFVSVRWFPLFQKSSERISVLYQGSFSRDLEEFQGKDGD